MKAGDCMADLWDEKTKDPGYRNISASQAGELMKRLYVVLFNRVYYTYNSALEIPFEDEIGTKIDAYDCRQRQDLIRNSAPKWNVKMAIDKYWVNMEELDKILNSAYLDDSSYDIGTILQILRKYYPIFADIAYEGSGKNDANAYDILYKLSLDSCYTVDNENGTYYFDTNPDHKETYLSYIKETGQKQEGFIYYTRDDDKYNELMKHIERNESNDIHKSSSDSPSTGIISEPMKVILDIHGQALINSLLIIGDLAIKYINRLTSSIKNITEPSRATTNAMKNGQAITQSAYADIENVLSQTKDAFKTKYGEDAFAKTEKLINLFSGEGNDKIRVKKIENAVDVGYTQVISDAFDVYLLEYLIMLLETENEIHIKSAIKNQEYNTKVAYIAFYKYWNHNGINIDNRFKNLRFTDNHWADSTVYNGYIFKTDETGELITVDGQHVIDDTVKYKEGFANMYDASGCRESCVGLCSNSCASTCFGCSEACFGACSAQCSDCDNACMSLCRDSCMGDCKAQCQGCQGQCFAACRGTCSGACADECKNLCGSACTGSCFGADTGKSASFKCGCGSNCTGLCGNSCEGSAMSPPAGANPYKDGIVTVKK